MQGETANRVIGCVLAVTGADQALPATHLRGQLGVDSLDLADIASLLEETFGISVNEAEVEKWETISDVITTVEAKL
jgi:acyl carrier protein